MNENSILKGSFIEQYFDIDIETLNNTYNRSIVNKKTTMFNMFLNAYLDCIVSAHSEYFKGSYDITT